MKTDAPSSYAELLSLRERESKQPKVRLKKEKRFVFSSDMLWMINKLKESNPVANETSILREALRYLCTINNIDFKDCPRRPATRKVDVDRKERMKTTRKRVTKRCRA